MSNLTLGSLFAGIGGFELAATWAGITPVWSNEIDPFCCKVLRKNFNHEIIEEDIRSLTANANTGQFNKQKKQIQTRRKAADGLDTRKPICVKQVDIISGGFPCQPFSHAGKRKGKHDDRHLWPEMLRIIREVRPRWIVAENVAGLVSMENGETLERIFIDLEDSGYNTEAFLIPACGVGAWHRRDRVWIVAHNDRFGWGNRGIEKKRDRSQIKAGRLHINVSNTPAKGLQNRGGSPVGQPGTKQEFERQGSEYGRLQNVPDSRRIGQEKYEKQTAGIEQYSENNQRDRQPEPRLGRMASRVSSWLDGYWDSEPEGIPRVATGVKNRVHRLKAMGNSIVPQVAYQLFKAIVEHENIQVKNT